MKKKDHRILYAVVAIAVLFGILLLFGGRGVGNAIAQGTTDSSNDDLTFPALYCGSIPLVDTSMSLQQFTSVGKLRDAMSNAELATTLPLPLACVFDCGLRYLPAKDSTDFMDLMSNTNFGQTLNKYACKLPPVAVTNAKGDAIVLQ